ncbi:unnamed protein product [Tuber melanosporum]|uniref:(Perigord truffle) hypothetical protein n=1 Tax=Tuber melanosporum (strain Mel28) TaxID=656061 RepID=D5GIR3_TUBMM|nr:uncharacterized protein GSTUM_00008621001 [Tuber melanosporum]CAZ84406.1 unnamed protein product [Tuber melanosporum]
MPMIELLVLVQLLIACGVGRGEGVGSSDDGFPTASWGAGDAYWNPDTTHDAVLEQVTKEHYG